MFEFSNSALATSRASLVDLIWRTEGELPSAGVDTIETGVADPLSTSAAGLASVDKFTTDVDDATNRINYLWRPTAPNGKLVIYHYGHTSEDWNAVGKQVEMLHALTNVGYTICGSQMPPGSVTGHNLYPVPDGSLNPLKYFLEDVIRCINEIGDDYDAVYMTGLSGGGWTTVLCAAIDTRIERSIHVDGNFPLFISEGSRDYEQFLPGVATAFDYTDLYVMGASNGRRQMQLHVEESGLFDKAAYDTDPYESAVAYRVPSGGSYAFVWDATVEAHEISAAARSQILSFLAAA